MVLQPLTKTLFSKKSSASIELIFSANSVIDTDNGNVYPLVAETGDILYDEKKNIVDLYRDYDNNYKWFLSLDVWDKKVVNEVILKLITKKV